MSAPTTDAPSRFGWCMTGHHGACPVEIGDSRGITKCGCDCHEEKP